MAAKTEFKWNQPQVMKVREMFRKGLINMGFAIANQARRNAPVETRALENSIRTTVSNNDTVYVIAGGTVGKDEQGVARVVNGRYKIPYARRREYENKKHPQTKHYLGRAFKNVTSGDVKKYWRFKG